MPPDSLRRALTDVFARPEYRWAEGRPLGDWALSRWRWLQDWLDGLAASSPTAYRLVLVLLLVGLAALGAHLVYVLWQVLRSPPEPARPATAPAGPRDPRAARARAEELAAAGRYVEALAHRFLAALLDLERVRALAIHPAKTPAEYVGEARLDPAGRETFRALVGRLYRHLFGAEPCDAQSYRDFGAAADDVLRHVAPR